MRTRIIAALIAIPIFVIPIYLGGFWGLVLGIGVTILGSLELFYMLQAGGYHPLRIIGVPWAVMLFLSGWDVDSIQQSSISITGWLTEPTIWVMERISFPLSLIHISEPTRPY